MIFDTIKFTIVAVIVVSAGAWVASQYERILWRVDCALHVQSACDAIELRRSEIVKEMQK